jgi:hypothetical protein
MMTTHGSSSFPILRRLLLPGGLAAAFALLSPPVHAQIESGESSGTPLSLNVSSAVSLNAPLLPVSGTSTVVAAVPLSTASGNAPAPYSEMGGPLNFTAPNASIGLNATSGLLNVNAGMTTLAIGASALTNTAQSTVDGGAGFQTTGANAGVAGLSVEFGLISATVDAPLSPEINVSVSALRITTGAITSLSEVSGAGTGENLDASFSTSVLDFDILLFGVSILPQIPIDLSADLEAGFPVEVTIDLAEISITLPAGLAALSASGLIRISNAGAGSADATLGSATGTALKLGFENISISAQIGGLIDANTSVSGLLTVGETEAVMQAVPEPATTLLAAGALVVLMIRRRR